MLDCTADSLESLVYGLLGILSITYLHWALSAWTAPNHELLCPRSRH